MGEKYDVIVVGGGPGGSTAAGYLGRAGLKTLLLDKEKFPRDKTCGDALSGKSMRAIRELGFEKEIEKLPHSKIRGVIFSSPSGNMVDIPFPKNDPNRKGGSGYCMRRIHTDKMFFEAAKKTKNVEVKQNIRINEVIIKDGYAIGVRGIGTSKGKKKQEFFAKVIVGADGVNSVVAKSVLGEEKAKLDPKHSCDAVRRYYSGVKGVKDKIEIHFFESIQPGYFWIFPLENGDANVGLGLLTKDLRKKIKYEKKNLVSMFEDAIKNEPVIKQRFVGARPQDDITGWRLPFGSHKRQVCGNGWVLIGDAASMVDPFSGEGVGNATLCARLSSQVIANAIKESDVSREKLREYEKNLHKELDGELDTSYKMQQLGRFKWLLNRVVQKAEKNDEIRELISASLANEEAKKEFKNPLFYLKIFLP